MKTTVPRGRTYYMHVSWTLLKLRMISAHLCGLLERLLGCGDEDHGVWTKTVLSRCLHILGEIVALLIIDEGVGAELLQTHLPLLLTGINGDRPHTHSTGVLLGKGTKTTTATDNADSLPWPGTRLLQALVDGDTSAENWCNRVQWDILWNDLGVAALDNGVLLEGSINSVPGEKCLRAKWLVGLLAEIALEARTVDPLYTRMITTAELSAFIHYPGIKFRTFQCC